MDIFEIIKEKEWSQLTVDEAQQFLEMEIDEAQFIEMKSDLDALTERMVVSPSSAVKTNLDKAFVQMHANNSTSFFAYWKWASIAAVGLIIIGVGVSFLVGPKDTVQLAKAEFEQEKESVGLVPNADTIVKDAQKEDLKIEIQPAIVQRNEEPKHLGVFVPTEDDIKHANETLAQVFEKAEEAEEIIKSENVASSSKMISKESRSDLAMPTQELPRASSFNSSENSVLAYRKMAAGDFNTEITSNKSINWSVMRNKVKNLVTLF